MFNASLDPGRQELVYKQYYNIGFAADTPRGLIVPVVKNADALSITQIAQTIRELALKAREGTIEVQDLQGGTFTITNVGALGGTYVVPTINYPECAILAMGRIEERPVIRGGQVVARTKVPLCITFDHRIADGADAARFMNTIVGYLSDPLRLMSEM
jgi:pyruvate dehydrogenase E2 component (dihydrolipoamide acetyltransferase)